MSQRINYTPSQVVSVLRSNVHTEIESVTTFLYTSFKPVVASYIFKQGGDYEDAKDIFQDVILIFFRQVYTLKFEPKSFKELEGYFIKIAHNKWLKKKQADERREQRENEYTNQHETLKDTKTPQNQLENDENSNAFNEVLKKLGEPCRTILLAYYGEELSIKEIAAQLNIGNPEAMKVRKFRCLEKLKTLLSKNE